MRRAPAWRRFAANGIDLLGLYAYIAIVVAGSFALDTVIPLHETMERSYALRHLVGLFTLTLPLVAYFAWSEAGPRQATLGKRVMGLRVVDRSGAPASIRSTLVRNAIKFLPWEIAHTHLHLCPEFTRSGELTPASAWLGLVLPMALGSFYVVMVLVRGGCTVYEWASGTRTVDGGHPVASQRDRTEAEARGQRRAGGG